MNDKTLQSVMATWVGRGFPARLGTQKTAELLGFEYDEVEILVRAGILAPLGEPEPDMEQQRFAAVEIARLVDDRDWLHRATLEVAKYPRDY